MTDSSRASAFRSSEAVLLWAREAGLVADAPAERRLARMRLEVLAEGALPHGRTCDVALTGQWAAFICWVDDHIDRYGLEWAAGEFERFAAPLREVFTADAGVPSTTSPHAVVLSGLWERTAAGMPDVWRARFAAEYLDFLDASEEEVALRRAGVLLPVADYVRLRRRTITLLPMLVVLERTGGAPVVETAGVAAGLRDLRWAVADVAGWANDLASEADDAAAGQDNLVAALAREEACSKVAARLRVSAMIEERRAGFRADASALRTGRGVLPEQPGLCRYVDLVENFMAATLHWLAVTGRFASGPSVPYPPANQF
ncbi:terpene synthase family protein [Streptomyces sp. NPDC060028]|uniref:terpene synthase family protein n=1 Tax=Streptomyces sp. NPDC060028 TaxID=3347041 RepID=UPI00369A1E6A